jgi:hypothetical protein
MRRSGMRRRVYRTAGCLTVIFVMAIFKVESPAQNKPRQPPPNATAESRRESPAIFAVSQNGSESFLDPVVIVIGGRYTKPSSGEGGEAAMSRFAARYYRPGQKYSLFFGGGKSGSVTVKQWLGKSEECNRSMAGVSLNTTAKIEGKVMGLATNVDSISRRESSRRIPTQGERASVVKLAQSVFTQKGATAPLLQGLRTINMTAMDLDDDGSFEVVGSFMLKKKGGKEARGLFLIAEPRGAQYRAGFTRHEVMADTDLPGGASLDDLEDYVLAEILVDQLDLDRDGKGEIVTMDRGFEGVTYKIYKREKARWRKVYEYYSYKCAF